MERRRSRSRSRHTRRRSIVRRAPSPPTPPPPPRLPTAESLTIKEPDAARLRKHAYAWRERQLKLSRKRLEDLYDAIWPKTEAKTRHSHSVPAAPEDTFVRRSMKREFKCWRAVRESLKKLNPEERLDDALEILYLGPVINSLEEQSDNIQFLQKTYERRIQELQDLEDEMAAVDEKMVDRFSRCHKYYRGLLRKFDLSVTTY